MLLYFYCIAKMMDLQCFLPEMQLSCHFISVMILLEYGESVPVCEEEEITMAKGPKTGLTKKHWFGYMFGDWGGCMTFTLMASIFGLYCTNVLGIDPTLMGTLTLIWTIWDAINDPMMGALMDKAFAKNQNKNGKFRP